ncbi:hypothetical protein [Croceicoccus marinus]|jgi:hypothetical protein|uniref:Uncharacterized protein n=1 Tax=Croceicoccus marinus TaxID=450378 RepID=A0A7G6VWD6_9SPHN|nr:hypothetical protein [Croceicoccus marinus]QNE06051.1 hypothetical protein H4O24_05270 [Croceicoccus marinus]
MTNRNRFHSVLWAGALGVSGAICFALMLQVTAVKSDIADAERQITSVQEEIATLETEFQTRARQQQLARWNEVDFGYVAPDASQFMSDGTQLAALGKPLDIAPSGAGDVLMADAADAPALAEGVRLAAADTQAPQMMRQLVARDEKAAPAGQRIARPLQGEEEPVRVAAVNPKAPKALTAGERAEIARRLAPEPAPKNASQFAESFDFGGVVAEAGAKRN